MTKQRVPWAVIIEDRRVREDAEYERSRLPLHAPRPEPQTPREQAEPCERGIVSIDFTL